MVRIAINGFGRIGRMVYRVALAQKAPIELVAINDLTDTKTLAHLFKYDSVHGNLKDIEVSSTPDSLIIGGKSIKVMAEREPEKLPWKALGVDVVVECTGRFTDREGASKHLKAGAKKVLISAPAKNPDFAILKGVNEHLYDKAKHHIISNESCTTNCFAPIVKVVHDNFRVRRGYMVTAHAYTADQVIHDAPHKDLRRARAANVSIVPTTSGSDVATGEVIPELHGKLHTMAMRVPVIDGSVIYFIAEVEKQTTRDEVNNLFKNVSQYNLKGIIQYCEDPIVSVDIIGNSHSSIFDSLLTEVDGDLVKIVAWYDNEWGYSSRMVDVLQLLV